MRSLSSVFFSYEISFTSLVADDSGAAEAEGCLEIVCELDFGDFCCVCDFDGESSF